MKEVGVKDLKDLRAAHFRENFGGGLLVAYGGSPMKVIESIDDKTLKTSNITDFPQFSEKTRKPKGFWVRLSSLPPLTPFLSFLFLLFA
jgi:hypothetical protein